MRIALVFLGRRGGPAYSYCAAQALAGKCELMAVVSSQSENVSCWRNLPLDDLEEVDTFGGLREAIRRGFCLPGVLRIVRRVKAFRPDVIYIPMSSPLTPLVCSGLRAVPEVLTIHDPILHPGDRGLLKRVFAHVSISQASRIVTLSSVFVPALRAKGIDPSCIDVIPHGHLGHYRAISAQTAAAERRGPTLLFFGRFEPYKGLGVLLEAFAAVKNAVPGARLCIVGNGDFSAYRARAAAIPDVEVINRWVRDEEVAGYFNGADVLVLPYTEASQSGVVAIAASFGVPTVASNTGGLAEQVQDGVNGLLVPPAEPAALAWACISVLSDAGLRARLAAGAKRMAEGTMSWAAIGDQIYESCRKAMLGQCLETRR